MRVAVGMLALAHTGNVDHIVLFAHSAAYTYPIEQLRKMGITTTIVSPVAKLDKFQTSNELRQAADTTIDLQTLLPAITRNVIKRN
jgi:uncharacterized LabA/DUF88 family protein